MFSRRVRGGDTDFLLIGIVFDARCFCAARVFSAPHVARRIACLWLRCVDGVVIVFVESLRLFQSFDTCVFGEVCHCQCQDFFMVVGQLESRFTWVLKGVFLKALWSFQHVSF